MVIIFRTMRRHLYKRGFTFFELFLVLLIIGIIIAVSLPQFRKHFNNLELTSFSRQLQDFMNYLHQRSIVERKIYLLFIDTDSKQYWAQIQGEDSKIKTFSIPEDLRIDVDAEYPQIRFYPNGDIDTVTFTIINKDDNAAILTTEGVFGGVKLQEAE